VLEGFREPDEREGIDVERSWHVTRRLVDGESSTPAAFVRSVGRGASLETGRCVVPVPIRELMPLYGPISADVAFSNARVGIYFQDGQTDLTIESKVILTEMARWLQRDKKLVRVEGHTHATEAMDLAIQRASAVKKALVGQGVLPELLRVEGCGSRYPLSRTQVTRVANQRVELHFIN